MTSYFFDNSGAWLSDAVPKMGEDAVLKNDIILKISKTSISQAGYGKLVVPASSSIEFVTTDTTLYLKTLHLRGSTFKTFSNIWRSNAALWAVMGPPVLM